MKRRAFLTALAVAPAALAAPRADALLLGDSLAFQLGPRLRARMKSEGEVLAWRGVGGSSAREWRELGWWEHAMAHPTRLVLASLGVNCTRSDRPKLGAEIARLAALCPYPLLWLVPPPSYQDGRYITDAIAEAAVPSFSVGRVPMGRVKKRGVIVDDVHPTHAGYVLWAERLYPEIVRARATARAR